jgi:hypothetical protein
MVTLSGGAALLMAVSGCGDNKVNDYANKVCGNLQPHLKKITDANKSITSTAADGKPEDIKKADSAAFQQISAAYAAISEAVQKSGVPPVDGGEKVQKDTVKELDATAKAYADLKASVDKLNTKDQAKFAEGLQGIANDLNQVNKGGSDAIKKLQSGEIGKAMSRQSGCRRPAASATAS